MKLLGAFAAILIFSCYEIQCVQILNEGEVLDLEITDNGIAFTLTLDDVEKVSGVFGTTVDNLRIPANCEGASQCFIEGDGAVLNINAIGGEGGFYIYWETDNVEKELQDCYNLDIGSTYWYGGPEKWQAEWPIERTQFSRRPYVSIKTDNGAVSERYWLNSKGTYIAVTENTPLFLDQNNIRDGNICFIASGDDPYGERNNIILEYLLVAKRDPREAHLHAVNYVLGKPRGHPNETIIINPIWTTWARFKKDISDDIVLGFAAEAEILGFGGQIEIDDYWETCYGSLTFNDQQFPNITSTVARLKEMGFTVSLWVHPFVNEDCEEPATYGKEQGYFVKSKDGSDITSWWDGDPAHYIDFTNPDATNWFVERLKLLQEKHGIDSFKFDAGESDYPPPNPDLKEDVDFIPNILTSEYVRAAATFVDLIEVRSASRTQDLPVFLRMLDKDSRWGLDNGLHSLITTLLVFNINGYTMVLPDMIGGNGYGELPTAELLVRWTQANLFMPTMQFSYMPYDFTTDEFDVTNIIRRCAQDHRGIAYEIIEAMQNSIENGTPVNPPIWWIDPTNDDALKVNDEFLLGESILVAPVIVEGARSRDIVLPRGTWKDGNTAEIYEGPTTLMNYSAPIDILPHFYKM